MHFWLSILFIFCAFPVLAAEKDSSDMIRLNNSKKYDITTSLQSYTEGIADVSAQLAYCYFEAGKFRHVAQTNNEYINDGLVNKRTWFAVRIDNTSTNETSLVLEYILSGVNSIECYTINDEQRIQPLIKSKNDYSKSSDGLLAKSVSFNINLQAGEKIILLMHTVNNGQLLYIPTLFFDTGYFREYDSNKHNFYGIFQGIFFFIIVFNFLLYVTTFDKVYLYYLLYAFFISIFALNEVGTATYSLSYLPALNYFSGQTFLFIGFAIWLLLMLQFLSLTKDNRLLYRLTLSLAGIDLIFAFLPKIMNIFGLDDNGAFQGFYQSGIVILFATNLFFIIVTNLARILKGNKLAIFYAVANIPVLLGVIIYYTNYYDITHLTFGWSNPVALGLCIETFLISFGFAFRYNLISKEKQNLLIRINEQQQEITQQIIAGQETERKRIAEDLHDELGSNLAALKLRLQKVGLPDTELKEILFTIDKASDDTRNIAHNLMPPEFEKTSLKNLLSSYYSKLNHETTMYFTFHSIGNDHHFSKDEELVIYRIIMELTNNIFKHSEATDAAIQLIYYEDHVELMAEDNGKGMKQQEGDGIGLKNIRSRVNYLNGTLQIDSNSGTTIMIQIPYKKK